MKEQIGRRLDAPPTLKEGWELRVVPAPARRVVVVEEVHLAGLIGGGGVLAQPPAQRGGPRPLRADDHDVGQGPEVGRGQAPGVVAGRPATASRVAQPPVAAHAALGRGAGSGSCRGGWFDGSISRLASSSPNAQAMVSG